MRICKEIGAFRNLNSFVYAYHQLESKVLQLLRLTGLTENKRKALYSFPTRKEAYYRQLLLKNGYSVSIVNSNHKEQ